MCITNDQPDAKCDPNHNHNHKQHSAKIVTYVLRIQKNWQETTLLLRFYHFPSSIYFSRSERITRTLRLIVWRNIAMMCWKHGQRTVTNYWIRNTLSLAVRSSSSPSTFKRRLKTELFSRSFPDWNAWIFVTFVRWPCGYGICHPILIRSGIIIIIIIINRIRRTSGTLNVCPSLILPSLLTGGPHWVGLVWPIGACWAPDAIGRSEAERRS